jgi:hypothetical protein
MINKRLLTLTKSINQFMLNILSKSAHQNSSKVEKMISLACIIMIKINYWHFFKRNLHFQSILR